MDYFLKLLVLQMNVLRDTGAESSIALNRALIRQTVNATVKEDNKEKLLFSVQSIRLLL